MPLPAHVLVTGARGFVGRQLVAALAHVGVRVSTGLDNTALDVTSRDAVLACFNALRPNAVVHLAAKTYLPDVAANPRHSYAVNVGGTLHVLQAAAAQTPAPQVLYVSSCTVYGDPLPQHLPLREEAPLDATHPYGLQKLAAEHLCQRAKAQGLDVKIVRPFNHIGAGMNPKLSLAHFAAQIAKAERGLAPALLRVGNLAAERDFLHVADVIDAYLALLAYAGAEWIFNVASGQALSLRAALDEMLRQSTVQFTVEIDPSRLRAQDPPRIIGCAERLAAATGWAPKRTVNQALSEILAGARGASVP